MVENVPQAESAPPAPQPANRLQAPARDQGGGTSHAEDIYFRRCLPQPTNPPPLDQKGTFLDTVI